MITYTSRREFRTRGSFIGLGLAVVAGAACSSGPTPVASKFVKTATVDASGGTVTVAATDDLAIAGTSITIPPHALASATTISIGIAAGASPRAGATAIGPLIDFEPSGTTFAIPVTITVPATLPSGVSATRVFVEEVDANQAAHQVMALYSSGLSSIQVTNLAEFGAYTTDAAVTCTTDTDCAPGGVCTAGTCTGTRVPPDDAGSDASVPGACSLDTDCPSGETCVDGLCAVSTTGDDSGADDAAAANDAGDASSLGDAAACTGAITDTDCGGTCVDLTSDSNNCGACGIVCASGTTCTMDRCF
jgi:hypothetical protein